MLIGSCYFTKFCMQNASVVEVQACQRENTFFCFPSIFMTNLVSIEYQPQQRLLKNHTVWKKAFSMCVFYHLT